MLFWSQRHPGTFLGAPKRPPWGSRSSLACPPPAHPIKDYLTVWAQASQQPHLFPAGGAWGPPSSGLGRAVVHAGLVHGGPGPGHTLPHCALCAPGIGPRPERWGHTALHCGWGAVAAPDQLQRTCCISAYRDCVSGFFKCLNIFYSGNFNFKEKKQTGANVRKYKP